MTAEKEIIIIEDDPIAQVAYAQALSRLECNLSFCSTVSLALNLCDLVTPDIVIVDLGLPDGNGIDAIQKIVDHFSDQPPYVLVATASKDENEHLRAKKAGADAIMIKPIADQALIDVVKSAIDGG